MRWGWNLKWLFPWRRDLVKINLDLEDRVYRLGDSMKLTVELRPRKDLGVKEGRIDLVFEEAFPDTVVRTQEVHYQPWAWIHESSKGNRSEHRIDSIGKRETKDQTNALVRGSVVFLKDASVGAGDGGSYRATLEIDSERPSHGIASTLRWILVASLQLDEDTPQVTHAQEVTVELA